ncbi:hypothetical protein OUZ56_026535 [Daphnia magna]|uniref:Uncharacterized protein n=1 Tax=Daphnia magna TaxID=35525 RepID=A0ABQ9ZM16_9CRUS|nr:hypothetical protein OUZ56_026535 [Daphnia magna]
MDRRGDGVRNNRASDRNQGGRHASSRRDSRAEKKARREHEFESRIGEGLMPTDREKIREGLVEYGDYFSWPVNQLGLCTAAEQTIEAGGKYIRDREAETRETIPLDEEVRRSTRARMPPVRYGQMPQAAVGALLLLLGLLGPRMGELFPPTQLRSVDDSVDDSEREKRAAEHHTYPNELWGVGAALFMASVAVLSIQWCRGRKGDVNMADLRERLRIVEEFVEEEAKKRRAWRWSTMHCLTEIDNRMTAHEETCLTTLRDLESSIEHLA